MRRPFRDHERDGRVPIDMAAVAANLKRAQENKDQLRRTVAGLVADIPGNCEAVAAAGIAFRAQLNRSATMIEFGAAAVDALRMAGYLPPASPSAEQWQAPEATIVERRQEPNDNRDVPEDWV